MASGSWWNLWVWLAGGGCGWNLWVWLVGVVVWRYIFFFICDRAHENLTQVGNIDFEI